MLKIQYYQNDVPIDLEWKLNEEKTILQLYLNGKKEPLIIELTKTNISGGYISAKYDNKIRASAKKYELGKLKKNLLADIYKIKYKYLEV